MSVREVIKCSVCHKQLKKVGQKLMNHKCSKQLEDQKCTVVKCPLCKKDVVKLGRKSMGHKCQLVIRPQNKVSEETPSSTQTNRKNVNQNRLPSSQKRFRCSLCNKDLERVGQKFMSHECTKLMDRVLSKEKNLELSSSLGTRTYVKCHLCNELVEKVGQGYKNHKCSTSTVLQSAEKQVEQIPFIQADPKDVGQPLVSVDEKCLLCDGEVQNSRQEISCHHLPKKKDHNLEISFKYTNQSIKHSNSCINVDSWVKEHMDKGVVKFYKPKGSVLHSHPDLCENDFIIMILNEAQCKMLKRYGSDCVCLDATEGLKDDFELVTLMVLNGQGEGLPCCFMITNRVDSRTMEILFNVIKTVVGSPIGARILMTDVSRVFWNAWNVVMHFVPLNWLFTPWKVEAAWEKRLSLIRQDDKRIAVQKTLTSVFQERDETVFTQLLGSAIEEWGLDQDTVEFSSHFISEFSHNVTNWAYCYRKHLGEDKNSNLERMHPVLRSIHQLGNQTESLDKFIPSLMMFIQDKIHNEKVGQDEDDVAMKISNILRQHKGARRMKNVQVTKTNEGWSLISAKGGLNHKIVVSNLTCDCKIKCDFCKVCLHSYKCSCHDSSFTICKHIHYLAINDFRSDLIVPSTEQSVVPSTEQSVEPTTAADTIRVVFDQNLGVDYFVSGLLEESFETSINSMSTLETDATTIANSHLDLQSPSRTQHHNQNDHLQVVDELENRKRKLSLEFQQILDRVNTLKEVDILETFLKPILPALVASQTSSLLAAQAPGHYVDDNTPPLRQSTIIQKEQGHS